MLSKTFGSPMAGILADTPQSATTNMVLVGLPDDSQSSYRRGPASAPAWIRRAYDGACYNASTEMGEDLSGMAADLGDWPAMATWEQTYLSYLTRAAGLFSKGMMPFFLGGDHAVTVPIVEALSEINEPVHVIQIDAHPDLYDSFEGNPNSHATTGNHILHMNHVASLTMIGVRAITKVQLDIATRHKDKLHLIPARRLGTHIPGLPHIPDNGLVYLTIDLDAFDPAYAPGVSHPVPGGLTSRQVFDFIQDLPWTLVGLDVVELNRDRDLNDLTAVLAGGLIHEAMGLAVRQAKTVRFA
jgi:arginase